MAERDTARKQLARLLHILPAAARDGGVSLEELADELGVTRDRVVADLTALSERAFYHPAGTGDDLQLLLEADRVSIWTTGQFRRPVRLTPLEALCVALGLRGLGPDDARAALLERLEGRLALTPDSELRGQIEAPDLAPDPSGLRAVLSDAIRRRTPCRLGYLKAGADAPEVRELEPWALVHAEGQWYAVGRDRDRDQTRAYRLDRILGVEVGDGTFRVPDHADPRSFVEGGRVFFTTGDDRPREAVVRYSPAVARWIRERWDGSPDRDGGYRVRHPVGDPGWLVRHVLRYGPDAEVMEPAELRALVRETALRVSGAGA